MPSSCELFILRDENGPILYAPLKQLSARINESAVGAVSRRLYGKALNEEDRECLAILEECGFFDEAELPSESLHAPVQVTIFPTDGCNLRCRYCYAGAEKKRHILPVEAGKAAIDLVADNAKALEYEDFVVGFHGNGEPFFAFDVVQELCRYAHEAADRTGLKANLTIATNGVMNEKQLDWLIAWFDSVNVSFDGLEDLQNLQRPMADGSGSFPYVHRTLKRLNDAGKTFGIRSTLTSKSVEKLPEIAAFVLDNYPRCDPLHVEPAWEAGRSLKTGERTPDAEMFVKKFLEADAVLDGRMKLVFSAARSGQPALSFCAVCSDSFVLTSEGLITSCYEVAEPRDPRSGRYIYGRYDAPQKRFIYDEEKQTELHRLNVKNMPYCKDCFCKYHCCGDCAAKLLGMKQPEEHAGSERCIITRALTLHQIRKSLKEEEEEHA